MEQKHLCYHGAENDGKGVIGYEVKGKTKYFYPLVEKEEAMIPETRSFLGRIYDGSVGALMNTLIRQGNLSEKDLDELEEILHNARKKADTQEE